MRKKLSQKLHGLYPINDLGQVPYEILPNALEIMFKNGVSLFQLRDKSMDKSHLVDVCKEIRALCDKYDALFLVDDDVGFALKVRADGVHLGKDDMDVKEARAVLGGDKIIGISCYGDVDRAVAMQNAGADYVAFGSFFPSLTKPHAAVVPVSVLSEAKKALNVPICAIGGITSQNAGELIAAGADMVAVISDIWTSDDLDAKTKNYRKIFDDIR